MSQISNKRLANLKTRAETGWDYVVSGLDIRTPFGKRTLKSIRPFFPGDEDALMEELDKVERMVSLLKENGTIRSRLDEQFMCLKNIDSTLERSSDFTLSAVEIFEVKSLLIYTWEIGKLLRNAREAGAEIDEELMPTELPELMELLDPRGDKTNTFYLYDEYSARLADLRKDKKRIEHDVRKIQRVHRDMLLKEQGIALTPKFDIIIPKSSDDLERVKSIKELEIIGEDYVSVTFALAKGEEVFQLLKEGEELEALIEEEETRVREMLSRKIGEKSPEIIQNCHRIGRLDYLLAKAYHALRTDCTKPIISRDHVIRIEEGRHLQVEAILNEKGENYCPISINLNPGVTCITGANMGGKTISLKLSGLVPLLAQYGFFVPCREAEIGLSNFIQILIGDSQSVERGLSSFGSEMEELKEIMDHAKDRSLILIDEIASGTNPLEGLALTKSLVEHFLKQPYITLITTHFESVTEESGVKNMQVRGLADADFTKLDREIRYANRRERIKIIGKYMDYRLEEVSGDREVPKDALNIAKMLGISPEIIEGARKYIK